MRFFNFHKSVPVIFALLFALSAAALGQNRDNLPAEFREYTNPEEVVTFDRQTPFSRALDVINEFAQKHRGKVVINRTETSGNIGISVPAMHWMDALKLILRVKELTLVEQEEFFEIVTPASLEPQVQASNGATGGGGGGDGEGPVATIQTHEVRINAIFFEGNRRALKEVGVDWSTISENVPDAILGGGQGGGGQGGQGGGQGGQLPSSQFDGPFVQVNSKGAQNVSQEVFSALVNVGEIGNTGIDVQALFSAFEANNLGEILASPTIKVMDGQQGRIQVGQDFSIKQRDIAGNVVEKFFNVGTILTVTPQVITQRDTTFIHLDIDAERSSAQPDPVSTIINKQQAQTQAILLDGETTVIAGLYNKEKTEVRRGVPILKDLPPWFFGLRYLFGYSSKDVQTRELVILLQASLTPSIPERFGDDFKNKYQVLQDEREQMRRELKQSDRALQGKELKNIEPTTSADSSQDDNSDSEQMKNEEPSADKDQQDMEQDSSASDEMNTEDQQENESPAIADPEVQPEKVELNLGGNTQDSTVGQQSQEMDITSNQTTAEQTTGQAQGAVEQPSQTYYLIGGSFEVEQNAVDMRDQLQDQGFDSAIINMNDSDIMLVAYQGFDDLGEAKNGLANIQDTENAEAWLYKAQ